jgi:hypothetical protein
MALNWNTAARIFIDTKPKVDKSPVWSDSVYYVQGSIVSKVFVHDSDSELTYYNWYVNRVSVPAGEAPPDANGKWTLFISTDPNLPNLFYDSEIYDFINGAKNDYLVRFAEVDSDVGILQDQIETLLGLDSDLTVEENRTTAIENKKIIANLRDSDASDGKAIVWNTAQNKFVFRTLVRTVNNRLPDASGNVEINLAQTKTGTRDERADSDVDGTIFVVSDDSDANVNGTTYIFSDDAREWLRVIGYTDIENDRLYLKTAGGTMTGALKALTPVADSDVATKAYVDSYSDPEKQDKIVVFDSEGAMNPAGLADGKLARAEAQGTLWYVKGGVFYKFTIPSQNFSDSAIVDAYFEPVGSLFIRVNTYRFSEAETGRLIVTVNGAPVNYGLGTNCSGTLLAIGSFNNFKLNDSQKQFFTILLSSISFTSNALVTVRYISHNGVTTQVTLRGNSSFNRVVYSNNFRSFNFGEF